MNDFKISDARLEWLQTPGAANLQHDELLELNEGLEERLAAAEAVIARLPVTADGVPVVPGMEVWFWKIDNSVAMSKRVSPPKPELIRSVVIAVLCCDEHARLIFHVNAQVPWVLPGRAYSTETAARTAHEGDK